MKSPLLPSLLILLLAGSALAPASAQSVGRIRRSLDKATGGATSGTGRSGSASASAQTGGAAASSSQAQTAANEAAANQRNKAAQAGVDDRVVAFLNQRIEDGSVDAPVDLAKRYEEGKGVEPDPVEARRLYTLGAERGNTEAKAWLQDHPEPEKPAGETPPEDTSAAPAAAGKTTDSVPVKTPPSPSKPAPPAAPKP